MEARNSIKIVLLNEDGKVLLMCTDDPSTTSKDGSYYGKFWSLVGGKVEPGEQLMDAAIRELKEETGSDQNDVLFGPIVWFGELELVLSGKVTHLYQQFIVAHTKKTEVSTKNLTSEEQKVVKKLSWFSLDEILNSTEIIYPVVLSQYLPDILNKHYPEKPLLIDLAKKPCV